jgi:hypothetical protein
MSRRDLDSAGPNISTEPARSLVSRTRTTGAEPLSPEGYQAGAKYLLKRGYR